MGRKGIIFDIKEFAVFDGPGIRTTVFLKGCPLRCMWCHNPEGLQLRPQLMVSSNGCLCCSKCNQVCANRERDCTLCGKCVQICPLHLRKICGEEIAAEALADLVKRDRDFFVKNNGGVTFSGGEPLFQGEFLAEVLSLLPEIHKAMETSGYAEPGLFQKVIEQLDYIIMDIKIVDLLCHQKYTGVANSIILRNLSLLKESKKIFRVRIPVIPGVNDTLKNYEETARLLEDAEALEMVELLPYHITAGAKYKMVGKMYTPTFSVDEIPFLDTKAFTKRGIICKVL